MTLRASVNRHFPWGEVLRLLGSHAPDAKLPARVECPACGRTCMVVYEDRIQGGSWFHCSGCRFAGDAVELAALKWATTPGEAAGRLVGLGLTIPGEDWEDQVEGYVSGPLALRERVRLLWSEAQAPGSPHDNATTAQLQRHFGVRDLRGGGARWLAREARFVGYSHKTNFEAAIHPNSLARRTNPVTGVSRGVDGPFRVFVGVGWSEVALLPYCDLPGRITGFYIVGRGCTQQDVIWRRVHMTAGAPRPGDRPEGGLGMLPAILDGPSTCFAMADPLLAARLQMRSLANDPEPLPLVSLWGGPKGSTRDTFDRIGMPGRNVVFWGHPLDGRVFAAAAAADGRVSTAGPRQSSAVKYTDRYPPGAILEQIGRAAEHWADALEGRLAGMERPEAEGLIAAVDLGEDGLRQFISGCGPTVRSRLEAMLDRMPRRFMVGAKEVVEGPDGWFAKGELITDARPRIDRVVHRGDAGTRYQGSVLYKGREVPMDVDAADFDRDPMGVLRRTILDVGLGMPVMAHNWNKHLGRIAVQFHAPKVVRAPERIGWDGDQATLILPRVSMPLGGEAFVPEVGVVGSGLPGATLAPPDGLTAAEIEALGADDGATALLWAVVAWIAADVLSPALGRPRTPLGIVGREAQETAFRIARLCGCPEAAPSICNNIGESMGRLLRRLEPHCWPVLMTRSAAAREQDIQPGVAAALPGGVMAGVNAKTAAVIAINGDTASLVLRDRLGEGRAVGLAARLLSHYLADVLRRRLPIRGGGPIDAILVDMDTWFGGLGGHGRVLSRAATLAPEWGPQRSARIFAGLISRMFDDGELHRLGPGVSVDARARHPNHLSSMEGGLLHIPKAGVAGALRRKGSPPLETTAVTRALAEAGVLAGEDDVRGHPGWVVREEWFDEVCRTEARAAGLRLAR